MAILWRLHDNLFPIVFIICAVGCGFGMGYLYRFLFAETVNKVVLLMRGTPEDYPAFDPRNIGPSVEHEITVGRN